MSLIDFLASHVLAFVLSAAVLGLLVGSFLNVVIYRVPIMMQREWRMHRMPSYSLWGAPVLGVLFGIGWTPCIGPTLTVVQTLAFSEASAARGALLSFIYCLGLGLPFILLGLAFRYAAGTLTWVREHYVLIMRIGGGLLVLIGVLLVTGVWNDITIWMRTLVPGFETPL